MGRASKNQQFAWEGAKILSNGKKSVVWLRLTAEKGLKKAPELRPPAAWRGLQWQTAQLPSATPNSAAVL